MAGRPFSFGATVTEEPETRRDELPRHERDIIASIISDLASDCDTAFSRPPSNYRPSQDSYRSDSYRQGYFEYIQPRAYSMSSITSSEMGARGPGQSSYPFESNDRLPIMIDSNHASKRSSFSRPGSERPLDSTVSLLRPQEKRASGKSHLRQAHSAGDDDNEESEEGARSQEAVQKTPEYPSPAKTAVIMISLYISIFLVALDRTIIGPAIPAITNKFNSIADIGWYGSAYMLTSAGFILLYGRIYTFFPTKPVFLTAIFLFEAGSAVCGSAQSSMMLIIGRAISGLGSSGIFTGAILIMVNTVPLHRRPFLQGLFGACFGVASVGGPLLGGAFTGSSLTWRWCFYINLPLGGITILIVMLMLKLEEKKPKLPTWKATFLHLDPLGTILFLPAITCLVLALEWGAVEYSWSSPRLIALLVVFAVLFLAFLAWQYFTRNTTATVPLRILRQRSVACGGLSQFSVGSTMVTMSIYIPLWFQAIEQVSAMQSGINTIPLVGSVVVGSISTGILVQRIGYYTPFMIIGACFMSVGMGLLTTWNMNTGRGMWIGYQAVFGYGVGCSMQNPNLAIQILLPKRDIPIGTAFLALCQTLGGAVFAAVGQNLYIDKFSSGLESIGGLDVDLILGSGATDLTNAVPLALRMAVLEAYNHALTRGTFYAALAVACLAFPAALGMEWRSVKEKQKPAQVGGVHDEEKQQSRADEVPTSGIPQRPLAAFSTSNVDEPVLTPPVPAWKRILRSSGQFPSYVTTKVNPDLRFELSARNRERRP